jgi:endonuclease YncB( thermonuclease family)
MRKSRFITYIIILSFLLAYQVVSHQAPREFNADVSAVIDGDTIQLSNANLVRYLGLDTPELHTRKGEKWLDVNEPFAQEAKALNEELVKGKRVRLEFDVQRADKYGRLLAYCFAGNTFVNERILEEGLGLLYTSPPNVKYADILVAAQKKARDNQKGIWAQDLVVKAQNACDYVGRAATVEGKVLKVHETEKTIYLNFGRDYRNDFTAVIFRKDLPSFIAAGVSLWQFKGKIIRVFGKIKEYNGPEIIVRHPSQIEIIQ